ncbi:hypothetical protein LZ32DRAFT_51800 [Colletotrichum eremochloae]|nr:hypothetical protein LZ32DRAFT_51800 [Colletotrichum eremochloae]
MQGSRGLTSQASTCFQSWCTYTTPYTRYHRYLLGRCSAHPRVRHSLSVPRPSRPSSFVPSLAPLPPHHWHGPVAAWCFALPLLSLLGSACFFGTHSCHCCPLCSALLSS